MFIYCKMWPQSIKYMLLGKHTIDRQILLCWIQRVVKFKPLPALKPDLSYSASMLGWYDVNTFFMILWYFSVSTVVKTYLAFSPCDHYQTQVLTGGKKNLTFSDGFTGFTFSDWTLLALLCQRRRYLMYLQCIKKFNILTIAVWGWTGPTWISSLTFKCSSAFKCFQP